MSDTILEHDDLTPTQEYSIAGIVILLFGALYWFLNYGLPDFGSQSAALPAPVVLEADSTVTAQPERIALNDTLTGAESTTTTSAKTTSGATRQADASVETTQATGDQQRQSLAGTEPAANTYADDKALQAVATDNVAATAQQVVETEEKVADASSATEQSVVAQQAQQVAAPTDDADNSQQTAQSNASADQDNAEQQAQAGQVDQASQSTDAAAGVVVMDEAVSGLRDDLVNKKMENPVVMESVRFASGSSDIDLESDHQIKSIAGLLQQYPDTRLLVRGHTDSAGPASENKALSLQRARAMGEKLVEAGVASENIIIMGMGSAEPLSGNNTQQGRGKDRRVDVSITQ